MTDLTGDGGVLKEILRQGEGVFAAKMLAIIIAIAQFKYGIAGKFGEH